MGQKKRTLTEWVTIIGQQKASGLTQEAWCEANGINYHTFLDRSRRMRRLQEQESRPVHWVEARELMQPENAEMIHIEIGSFRVMVSDSFRETALFRVCKSLMSLC